MVLTFGSKYSQFSFVDGANLRKIELIEKARLHVNDKDFLVRRGGIQVLLNSFFLKICHHFHPLVTLITLHRTHACICLHQPDPGSTCCHGVSIPGKFAHQSTTDTHFMVWQFISRHRNSVAVRVHLCNVPVLHELEKHIWSKLAQEKQKGEVLVIISHDVPFGL